LRAKAEDAGTGDGGVSDKVPAPRGEDVCQRPSNHTSSTAPKNLVRHFLDMEKKKFRVPSLLEALYFFETAS
jgi:hypothetical protein